MSTDSQVAAVGAVSTVRVVGSRSLGPSNDEASCRLLHVITGDGVLGASQFSRPGYLAASRERRGGLMKGTLKTSAVAAANELNMTTDIVAADTARLDGEK